MTGTKETPTESGYYWVSEVHNPEPAVVYVEISGEKTRVYCTSIAEAQRMEAFEGATWQGPIQPE